jgi:hypothetical protein
VEATRSPAPAPPPAPLSHSEAPQLPHPATHLLPGIDSEPASAPALEYLEQVQALLRFARLHLLAPGWPFSTDGLAGFLLREVLFSRGASGRMGKALAHRRLAQSRRSKTCALQGIARSHQCSCVRHSGTRRIQTAHPRRSSLWCRGRPSFLHACRRRLSLSLPSLPDNP